MQTIVTLQVFSGLPDPTWVLAPKQAMELDERMKSLATPTRMKSIAASMLGYRGFRVTHGPGSMAGQAHILAEGGIIEQTIGENNTLDSDRSIERYLLGTAADIVSPEVIRHVNEHLANPVVLNEITPITAAACPPNDASDARPYNPGKWNVAGIQQRNNCYAYANDQITNTFPQPGRAHGRTATMDCASVTACSQADGIRPVAAVNASLAPGAGWYTALVVWPGHDYHWYRQDNVGCWSHKPGSTPARNVDNSNQLITNPQTANRGPYSSFCTFMVTNATVVIR